MIRWLTCCCAAGVGSSVFPLLTLLWGVYDFPRTTPPDSEDDAPYRAAVILLMLLPIASVLAVAYFAVVARALRALGRLSLKWLLLANIPLSLLVACFFARNGFTEFGVRDAAIAFGMLGGSSLLCLSLGSASWWAAWRLTGQARGVAGTTPAA